MTIMKTSNLCYRTLFLIVLFCLPALNSAGQSESSPVIVESEAEPKTITIGDPIELRVRITRAADISLFYPREEPDLKPFEILDVRLGQPVEEGEELITEDVYRVSVYETGSFEIPSIEIAYETTDGQQGEVSTEPVEIEVQSVIENPEEEQTIRDLKPPVVLETPLWQRLWPWLAILGAVILVGSAIFWLMRKRKQRPVVAPPPPPAPPADQVAFEALKALREDREGLLARGDFERFSVKVSGVLRVYLLNRFGLPAIDRTTEETLEALKHMRFSEKTRKTFEEFFVDCDLVKFARETLERNDMIYLIDLAWRLVEETRQGQSQPQEEQENVEKREEE